MAMAPLQDRVALWRVRLQVILVDLDMTPVALNFQALA
jgi:hypothetical protein